MVLEIWDLMGFIFEKIDGIPQLCYANLQRGNELKGGDDAESR